MSGHQQQLWKRAKVRVREVIHPILTNAVMPVMEGIRKARKASSQPGSYRDGEFPEQDKREFHILRSMDGPYYRCDYLGFTAISKPPTGVNALQSHLKDLYLKYRRGGPGGRDASLKLVQQGIFITLHQDGQISDELFFNFDAVNFIEVVKFAVVKTSSERKPKAIFIPVEETKGPVSDKHSFPLDKTSQFLASLTHPPLVACVVRRPKGVKALDCHLFALESVENALHITSLVGSSQTPVGFESKVGQGFGGRVGGPPGFDKGNSLDGDPRGDGNFNRGVRGDVIRPDYSDYSFYRGQQPTYETVQTNLQHSSSFDLGGSRLPPTNIQRRPPVESYVGGGPRNSEEGMVYGLYEQPRSGALIAGPLPLRPHDAYDSNVIMRKKDPMSAPNNNNNNNNNSSNTNTPINRSMSTGSDHSGSIIGFRHEELRQHINHRLSAGVMPAEPVPSPRFHNNNINNTNNVINNNNNNHNNPIPQPHPHLHHPQHPLPPHSQPPPLQQHHQQYHQQHHQQHHHQHPPQPSPRHDNPDFGPVFSASNLENREREQIQQQHTSVSHQHHQQHQEEISPDHNNTGGKPIAKVPPHLRGVKVLPTDFRKVKLKPMEKKGSVDSQDSNYDNNNDIMQKYKALQEDEVSRTNGNTGGYGLDPSESLLRPDRHNKQQDGSSSRLNRFSAPVYADWPPGGVGGHHPSPSAFNISGGGGGGGGGHDPPPKTAKDAEIASMFSNMGLRNGNARRVPQNGVDFEDSLGYLP